MENSSSRSSATLTTETPFDKPLFASNNLQWVELKPTNMIWAPPSRSCHTTVLFQHYMIIFGGREGEGGRKYLNDIFIFNIRDACWENATKVTGTLPPPRLGHTACLYDENKMVIFGGWDGTKVLHDTWTLTINATTKPLSLEWQVVTAENIAPKRQFHTSNICQNVMYVFGGGDGKLWGSDLYALNLKNSMWSLCDTVGEKPCGRLQHCSAIDQDKLYIFGGEPNKQQQLNDLHVLDIRLMKWDKLSVLGASPIPRVSASAQKKGNKLFFFGGFDGQAWLKDIFAYNIDENNWETIVTFGPSPKPRCRHTMVVHENNVVIFGGNDSETSFSDIYSLNLEVKLDSNNSTLAQDLRNLMAEKMFCDVVFEVEGQEIPAHKAILASRCEHFKIMFLSNLMESQTSKIHISDIKPHVFKIMLEYIYCDQILLNDELALELLIAANRYLLGRLKILCEQYLSQRLSVKNIVDIINAAEMHEADLLKECALTFMIVNREAIIESQDLLNISKTILIELYKRRSF